MYLHLNDPERHSHAHCQRYIKQAMVLLRDKFDSDVPKTVDELCSFAWGWTKDVVSVSSIGVEYVGLSRFYVHLDSSFVPLETMVSESTYTYTGSRIGWAGISLQRRHRKKQGNADIRRCPLAGYTLSPHAQIKFTIMASKAPAPRDQSSPCWLRAGKPRKIINRRFV